MATATVTSSAAISSWAPAMRRRGPEQRESRSARRRRRCAGNRRARWCTSSSGCTRDVNQRLRRSATETVASISVVRKSTEPYGLPIQPRCGSPTRPRASSRSRPRSPAGETATTRAHPPAAPARGSLPLPSARRSASSAALDGYRSAGAARRHRRTMRSRPGSGSGRDSPPGAPFHQLRHPRQDRGGVVAERVFARRELPGEHAEGEHVRPDVDFAAVQLFRRHVAGRAERAARFGQPRGGRPPRAASALRARPKSRTLIWPSVLRMMFSGFRSRWTMSRSCAAARAAAMSSRAGSSRSAGRRTVAELLAQRAPADQLRDDVQLAVDLLEREDRRDGRMRQRGGGARLARQPFAAHRIARELRRQRLERDRAPQPLVLGGVDDAHPAAPDFLEHAVRANLFPGERSTARRRGSGPRPRRTPVRRGTARSVAWLASSVSTSRSRSGSPAVASCRNAARAPASRSRAAWKRSLIWRQRAGFTPASCPPARAPARHRRRSSGVSPLRERCPSPRRSPRR